MRIEKQTLSDFNVAKNKEFLITNGLGGYASRTVNNLSSRIYSGLFIASLNSYFDLYPKLITSFSILKLVFTAI